VAQLNDIWNFTVDNVFPEDLLRDSERWRALTSGTSSTAKLCAKCRDIDFHTQCVHITDESHMLRKEANLCDFCKMRWDVAKLSFSTHHRSMRFHQLGSNLQLNRRYPPVFTINRGQGSLIDNFLNNKYSEASSFEPLTMVSLQMLLPALSLV
jgi:hypothetical protein